MDDDFAQRVDASQLVPRGRRDDVAHGQVELLEGPVPHGIEQAFGFGCSARAVSAVEVTIGEDCGDAARQTCGRL